MTGWRVGAGEAGPGPGRGPRPGRGWGRGALLVALAAGLGLVSPAQSAVLTVEKCDGHPDGADSPGGGQPGQLRFLLTAAADRDVVVIPAGCTITLVGPVFENGNLSGDLDIAKEVTIQGGGPGRSILDGGGIDRILDVRGGGRVVVSGLTLRNGNSGTDSGGAVRVIGHLTMINVHVTGNTADNGGGLFAFQADGVVLTHVTVSGNEASPGGNGGGIAASETPLRMTNVTVSGNRASANGGGLILNNPPETVLQNVTVTANSVETDTGTPAGGGFRVLNGGPTIRLGNTIIAGNTRGATGTPDDCRTPGPLASAGSNLVQDTGACLGLTGTDLVGVAPLLEPLALNGGPTATHALGPGSPAIDAGDGGCASVDQRGLPRPQGPRCDLGAFEAGAGSAGAFPDFRRRWPGRPGGRLGPRRPR
jgi:hypothetical protein